MPTVVFDKKTPDMKREPDRFNRHIKAGVGQIMEYGGMRAKKHSPSKVLSGAAGGRGGISHDVVLKMNIIIGVLTAIALTPEGENYAYWVHEGTGLYGKRKKRIFPKTKKVLAWTAAGIPRPGSKYEWKMLRMRGLAFIARSVKGQKPNPFLKKGMRDAKRDKAKQCFDRAVEAFNRGEQ
jgi:hypothetical protein